MAADRAEGAVDDRPKLLRLRMLLPPKMTMKRYWWRAAKSFPARRAKTGMMLRTTSRTSTEPMAFRFRRLMPVDADPAGQAQDVDRADREAIAGPEVADGADVADAGPVGLVVAVDRAAEIARLLDFYYDNKMEGPAIAGLFYS
jgi:hypothetical protein